MKAAKEIDRRLADDNARGALIDPTGAKVIRFPGRDGLTKLVYGPINQAGIFQGVPIKIGSENDPVTLHLEDGRNKYIVSVRRTLAKEIAQYLFTAVIRVDETGRWVRNTDGEWEMLSFYAHAYRLIEDGDIRFQMARLRGIHADWKDHSTPLPN